MNRQHPEISSLKGVHGMNRAIRRESTDILAGWLSQADGKPYRGQSSMSSVRTVAVS